MNRGDRDVAQIPDHVESAVGTIGRQVVSAGVPKHQKIGLRFVGGKIEIRG